MMDGILPAPGGHLVTIVGIVVISLFSVAVGFVAARRWTNMHAPDLRSRAKAAGLDYDALDRAEWAFIHKTLVQAKEYIERDGANHTWINPAVDIAAARMKGEGLRFIAADPSQMQARYGDGAKDELRANVDTKVIWPSRRP